MYKKIVQMLSFCLILTACSLDLSVTHSLKNSNLIEQMETEEGICEILRVDKVIDGNSMSPLLQNGQEVVLLENYYKCGNPVRKGDIVAYHYGGNERPLIKKVRVSAEDEIEILGKKLQVNGKILKNSVEREYAFSDGEIRMLQLYIKEKHLPQETFFLFGDNVSDSIDSRKFGAVSPTDFLGKFEL